MSRQIKISIKARGLNDSPTVDDLLDQVRDYFEILHQVEAAVADDGENAIEWRIVSATTNSPIQFVAEGYSRQHGVSIDARLDQTVRHAAIGLSMLRTKAERPSYFNDDTVRKAERLFERVTNGLEETNIDHGPGLPQIDLLPAVARTAARNAKSVLAPPAKPYEELGSVEGLFRNLGRDEHGRLIMFLRVRLTGVDVKCVISGEAAEVLGEYQIRDVLFKHRRLRVSGKLHYKGRGNLTRIDATKVRFLRTRSELPDVEDILEEGFTGGLTSEEYLKRLRDGELS